MVKDDKPKKRKSKFVYMAFGWLLGALVGQEIGTYSTIEPETVPEAVVGEHLEERGLEVGGDDHLSALTKSVNEFRVAAEQAKGASRGGWIGGALGAVVGLIIWYKLAPRNESGSADKGKKLAGDTADSHAASEADPKEASSSSDEKPQAE